jgi:hypothetical protein
VAKSKSGIVYDAVSQVIKVDMDSGGTATSTSTDTTATTTQSTSTSQTSTTTNTQVVTRTVVKYLSVHSNPEDLSDYTSTTKFEISAGRERVGYVGMPIKFIAKSNLQKINSCSNPNFSWIFGDGSKESGENVAHTYRFAGEYNIVLNAICGNESSVSRTKVKILKPEISLSLISSGDLEFTNLGKTEINIGDWSLVGSSTKFVFPEDTIISASSKMILSADFSKISVISGNEISLIDPSHKVIFSLGVNSAIAQTDIPKDTQAVNINVSKEEFNNFASAFIKNNKKEKTETFVLKDEKTISTSTFEKTEVATVLEAVKSTETKGFWKSLFSLPSKGIRAVARVFYDVE